MKERVVLSDDLGTWTGPGSRVARDAGPKRGGAPGADAPGRAVAPGGDDPVGALDVGCFVEAVRDRVCDVPRQQSEYPARRRGTSKVAARVLWRAMRRANADPSRSIGVRRLISRGQRSHVALLAEEREQQLYSCRVVAPGTRFIVEVRRTLRLVPLPQSSQHQALRPGRLLLAQQLSQEHPPQALRLVSVPRPERRVIPAPSRYPGRPIKRPVPSLFKDPDPHPSFTERARPPSMHLVPFVQPVSSRLGVSPHRRLPLARASATGS